MYYLKAQYWPLCFSCLSVVVLVFMVASRLLLIKEFYSGCKQKPQNFQHHKNGRQEIAGCNA